MHRDGLLERRWLVALITFGALLAFLVLQPYRGLVHDARLYTIQALGQLRPDLYGMDIFLRLGSQDDYTFFSSLHALVISWLGVEVAAAALTALEIGVFLAAFAILARSCMSREHTAAALLLVLIIPGYYGSARVFHFMEGFVSPRQLAEALCLLGIAAWMLGRKFTALALSTGAMLIHPIIALPGLLVLPTLEWIIPHWRRLLPLALAALALAALATLSVSLGWLDLSRWQFDPHWHDIVMNRGYLDLTSWTNEDWGRVLTVTATLLVASLALNGRQRSLAIATVIILTAMMALTFVGGELLRIALVVQGQPWRALWLATCIAILLMVPLYAVSWRSSPLLQCALWLIAAAWAAPHGILALVAAPLAVVAGALACRGVQVGTPTLLLWGSRAVFAVAATHSVAVSWLAWNEDLTVLRDLPPVMQKLSLLGESGVVPALLIAAVWWLMTRHGSLRLIRTLTVLTVFLVIAVALPAGRTWAASQYDESVFRAFGEWRERIPPGSEVLWVGPDQENAAIHTWLLLQRPAYVTVTQAPNALFSRAAAIEMERRAKAVASVLPFADPFDRATGNKNAGPFELAAICSAISTRYVVTHVDLADAHPIPAPLSAPLILRDHGLYICP